MSIAEALDDAVATVVSGMTRRGGALSLRRVGTPPVPYGEPVSRPEWLAYLREVCELLWPPPAVITMDDGRPGLASGPRQDWGAGHDRSDFALLAGIHRPPLLVPDARRAAAAALRHHSRPRSLAARLGVRALCLGMAGGLDRPLLRGRVSVSVPDGADTIEGYLGNVLSRDIRVSMYLGPARANRKPVLELLADTGEPAGFAKIGVNPLTCRLVREEHQSLLRLSRAGLTEITIPRVLHFDTWHGLEVLVLSALPAWLPARPLPARRLTAAMTQLAGIGGTQRVPLCRSDYLGRLRSRLSATDQGADRTALLRELHALTSRAGDEVLEFGAWHGDWSPWNMASTSSGLLVWDWERFTSEVPLGFDALHHRLQVELATGRRDPRVAATRCAERAPSHLGAFGHTPQQARLTAVLYLTDLATRYLADRQAQAGAPLGAPGTWLIPAIATAVARL